MNKIFVIGGSLLIVMTLVTLIIFITRQNKEFKITTLKKDYHYVFSQAEESQLEIVLYANDEKSLYLNKDMISKVYLTDNKYDNTYRGFISDIINLGESITIRGEKFYYFKFIINIESIYQEINIPEAILVLDYQDNNVFNISIGWVSLYKVDNFGSPNNELAICHLKGYVLEENNIKKLKGILLGLRNNSQSIINLIEINPLAGDVYFSTYTEVNNPQSNFKFDHNIYTPVSKEEVNIELLPGEVKYYILPITYLIKKNLSNFGLELLYQKNDQLTTMYFDDFIFFSDNVISNEVMGNLIINKYVRN